MKRLNPKIIFIVIAAFVMISGAGWWYSSQASQIPGAPSTTPVSGVVLQPVRVMKVSRSESSVMPQRYTATVVARRTSQLAFQAAERVDKIHCDEGDFVEKGQLLAQQDQAALKAQFDAAVARSKQTGAVLAELEKGPRRETIEAARAELLRLKAQNELAQSNFKRQASLRKTLASSEQEFDAAKFESAATQAAVASAQQKLDELEAGTRQEQIDAQRAALGVIKATIEQARTRLDQTKLFAPFSGRISKRFVDEGSLPQRGSPVLEIVETGHLEVRFGVSPDIAKKLSSGDSLTFTDGSLNGEGTVKQIQPTLDRATRTQQVIVSVSDSENSGLVDGQTVRVEFAVDSDETGFWIPTEALQPQVRGLWSVLVTDRNSGEEAIAQRRDVEVLATWGTWSRVRGTLEESENVVIEGGTRISAGQKVATVTSDIEFPWQQNNVIRLDESNQEELQ